MEEERSRISPEASIALLALAIFLIFAGFILIFIGLFPPEGEVWTWSGGLILIGPIPIVFQGRLEPLAILLILAVMALILLLPLLHLLRAVRRLRGEDANSPDGQSR